MKLYSAHMPFAATTYGVVYCPHHCPTFNVIVNTKRSYKTFFDIVTLEYLGCIFVIWILSILQNNSNVIKNFFCSIIAVRKENLFDWLSKKCFSSRGVVTFIDTYFYI